MTEANPQRPLAVLVSGGLDSAVLLGMAVRERPAVYPLYIRAGLAWEAVELTVLEKFLADIASPALQPLIILEQPLRDVYGSHWSTTGQAPGATAPDEDFYLPGRNVMLLAKSIVWCRIHRVPAIALAVLAANPFPDATPGFFRDFAAVVSRAVGGDIAVETPFAELSKADVVRRGRDLPLQHTMSCASPAAGLHCGICGKCAERGRAFITADVADPTVYAHGDWQGTTQRTATHRPWE